MPELTQGQGLLPLLSYTGLFESSNPNCPVTSYVLKTGGDDYDLVDRSLESTEDFVITMKETANSATSTYYFVIEAKTEGDAAAEAVGAMVITKSCIPAQRDDFDKIIDLHIPEIGTQYEEFPESSREYITLPHVECQQTFSYRMSDGSDVPSELTIDADTGVFTLRKYATLKTTYDVEIDVLTTDGLNDDLQTVSGVVINTVCGPESTTLTPPALLELRKASVVTDELSFSDEFDTSNPLCPITAYELTAASTETAFVLT